MLSVFLFVISGEIGISLLEFASQSYVRIHFETTGLTQQASWDIDLSTVLVGLVPLVVAEVFPTGSGLSTRRLVGVRRAWRERSR